jgi:putative tricarboxylic transport membrane protein
LSDLVSGLVVTAGGVAIILAAMSYPTPRGGGVGPQLFPTAIGAVLTLAGLVIALRVLLAGRSEPLVVIPDALRSPSRLLALLSVPAGILSFAILAPRIGTILASMIVVLAAALGWRERPVAAGILAILASLVVYWFFAFALRVPLPFGPLEGLLR